MQSGKIDRAGDGAWQHGSAASFCAAGLWVVFCDGSALPNPGAMGIGAILIDPAGIGHTLSQVTSTKGCNNEAELRALIAALHEASRLGATELQVHSDSALLVEQLGALPVKPIARLALLFDEARALLQAFPCIRLQWIPGHRNGAADALARAALGLSRSPPGAPISGKGKKHKSKRSR